MKVICLNCHSDILKEDININSNIAYCQECTNIFKLSDLLAEATLKNEATVNFNSAVTTENIESLIVNPESALEPQVNLVKDKKNTITSENFLTNNKNINDSDVYKEIISISEPVLSKRITIKKSSINLDKNEFNYIYKLAKYKSKATNTDLTTTPEGTWYKSFNNGFEIGASTRSPIAALFLIPFMVIWSGGSIGGLYVSQIFEGKFDLFRSLFGIPFLLGSIVLFCATMMTVFGKVYIKVLDGQGVIFTGVGSTGLQKFFNPDEISIVREEGTSNSGKIIMEGKNRYSFGSGLNSEKRYFFVKNLKDHFKK